MPAYEGKRSHEPRLLVLAGIGLFTAVTAVPSVQLRMDAGFEKQMPIGHEYIRAFKKYRNDLLVANLITVVVRASKGSIRTTEGLTRLYELTQAVTYLPNPGESVAHAGRLRVAGFVGKMPDESGIVVDERQNAHETIFTKPAGQTLATENK